MATTVYGVALNDGHAATSVTGVELVVVRDIAALCSEVDYRESKTDDATVRRFNDVVRAYGADGPVLPSPMGIVFRSRDSVVRWLELHYSALTGALTFVENRIAARVHVRRSVTSPERESRSGDAAVATESLRVLRRSAVTSLPLRTQPSSDIIASAAFLIEQPAWRDFEAEVDAQAKTEQTVTFELTGPWPPYDFVQMQLGA